MKIGIVELMPYGHYALVESIVQIFESGEAEITVLTNEFGASSLAYLHDAGKINVVIWKKDQPLSEIVAAFTQQSFDRLYITTLEKYFDEFLHARFGKNVRLFIHNIDDWFTSGLSAQITAFWYELFSPINLVYNLKRNFVFPKRRKHLIAKILQHGGKLVVLSSILCETLRTFVPATSIEVIPFSVYNGDITDGSAENKKLRICIPGMVSKVRRDYLSFFALVAQQREFFKEHVEIDLLGKIANHEGGAEVIAEAKNLIESGITIFYYEDPYVPMEKYNESIGKCDIILGNMVLRQGKASFYGKTKDTGIVFNMIKAAKPGLIPAGYPVLPELASSALIYDGAEQLLAEIKKAVLDKVYLSQLKKQAVLNAQNFTPARIYASLTEKQ
jgi:hypothetical protein